MRAVVVRRALHALLCMLAAGASAQGFPDRPIRMIAAFPAGGGVDIVARLVSVPLAARLGQPVLVENKTGASGMIGSAYVANAPADGYTILVTSNPSITIAAADQQTTYDPLHDLAAVVKATIAPSILVVSPAQPFHSMKDLIDAAKASDGRISYATAGAGSTQHLEMELLQEQLGIRLNHVPYRGTSQLMPDVIGGQVAVGVPATPAAAQYVLSGRLEGLAVISDRRTALLPDVPTLSEATGLRVEGIPSWFGFLVPAKTPGVVVARLEAEITAVLKDPAVLAKLQPLGMDMVAEGSAAFRRSNDREVAAVRDVLKRHGISITR